MYIQINNFALNVANGHTNTPFTFQCTEHTLTNQNQNQFIYIVKNHILIQNVFELLYLDRKTRHRRSIASNTRSMGDRQNFAQIRT